MGPDGRAEIGPDAPALEGIRILDATGLFGAYASRLLADLGADVIRVVPPAGDPLDSVDPFLSGGEGPPVSATAYFCNLGKRIVTLDIERREGREVFDALLARSDILIESWTNKSAARLSLRPEDLSAAFPQLVHVSVSPFGRTGPRADDAADDLVTMAAGGLLSLGGYPDAEPVVAWGNQSAVAASIFAGVAALMGLIGRGQGGQWFDVSAQEAVAAALEDGIPLFDLTGRVKQRTGDGVREAGTGILRCADGYVSMVAGRIGTARAWRSLVEWLVETRTEGAEALLTEEWQTLHHRQEPESTSLFTEIFERFAASRTKAQLYEEAQRRNIALAPVNEVADLFGDPQLRYREFFAEVAHPTANATIRVPGPPYRLASVSGPRPMTASAGQDGSRQILASVLGLTASHLDELVAAGVV